MTHGRPRPKPHPVKDPKLLEEIVKRKEAERRENEDSADGDDDADDDDE